MRGQGAKNVVAENLNAGLPDVFLKQIRSRKKQMCWKCQKDKSTIGGHIKTWAGGPMKFICKECIDAKSKENT
jgi:hypothetical protein